MKLDKWHGSIPTNCDLCGGKIENEFINGKTIYGPWGILCPRCHKAAGVGLGLGLGQRYMLTNVNGKDVFLCIGGSIIQRRMTRIVNEMACKRIKRILVKRREEMITK